MKVIVVGGVPKSLTQFRGPLIERLVGMGHDVVAIGGGKSEQTRVEISSLGARFDSFPLGRTQTNPFQDLHTLWFLYRWMSKEKPDLVLAYTVKPVIWGALASRLAGVKQFHALITGLGGQFTVNSVRERIVGRVVSWLYRLALANARSVIFQNDDDREVLLAKGLIRAEQARKVHGSGVDLDFYLKKRAPAGPLVFLTVSRLIGSKGIREYAAAARILRGQHPDITFKLVGVEEQSSDAISENEVMAWHEEGIIDYIGSVEDARAVLTDCHVYVLASYYGEGLPRSILEAMAIGRPVLTTDNVGCRDAVIDGFNGLVIKPRNVQALADGMLWFVQNRDLWPEMGDRSRELAEERYDVDRVNDAMLEIMRLCEPVASPRKKSVIEHTANC